MWFNSNNSVAAARALLEEKRAARGWDSNFWPQSDFMDIDTSEADTVFWETIWFSETIARDISDIIDSPTETLSLLENRAPK